MSHEQLLLQHVSQVRLRVRLLLAQQWLCVGVAAACAAALLLVAATRFRWWTDAVDWIWLLVAGGALAGALYGLTRRVTPLAAAQLADERAGLKERLSTAVEITGRADRCPIAEAQVEDAAEHARSLRPAAVLPWRLPRQAKWVAAAAAVLAAFLFLPDLPLFQSVQDRMDREAIRKEGAHVTQVAKELEKKLPAKKSGDSNEEIMRRVAQEMKRLGKDMENNRIPKKQAMLALNDLQRELKEAENRVSQSNAGKSLDKVTSDLMAKAEKLEKSGGGDQAKALRDMAGAVSKKDMDAARRQLEDLAQKLKSGQMNSDDARKAAETLEQMARSMQGSDLDKASQELKDAARQLQEAAEQARQMEQKLAGATSEAERREIQEQIGQQVQQQMAQAGQKVEQSGAECKNCESGVKSGDQMRQASQALQSAQESLQQAGQQQAQGGQSGNQESSQEEMGQEFGASGGSGQGQQERQGNAGRQAGASQSGQDSAQRGDSRNKGSGRGGAGQAAGGNVGPQDPMAVKKQDRLVSGQPDPRGKHLSRTYMGTPDPTRDRAAYYSIVPERLKASEASLNREEIPAPAKKTVKRYFEAIQPR